MLLWRSARKGLERLVKVLPHSRAIPFNCLSTFRMSVDGVGFTILKEGDVRDDEELCVARLSDRDAVMAIEPDGYAGYDYLPYTYHRFVSGPGVRGYLYKKRGKVAGFFSTSRVDSGQTLATSAGRIALEWRGDGMFGRFKRRVLQKSLEKYPDLRYNVMGTHNLNWDINGHKLRKCYRVIEERELLLFQMNPAEARQRSLRKPDEIAGIRKLTSGDLNTLMKDSPGHLFPNGRIMLDTKSFRIMEENTDLIYSQGDDRIFIGSSENSARNDGACITPSLLSCGSYGACRRGVTYEVAVYGTGSDEMIRAHLEWHLLRLVDVGIEDGGFVMVASSKKLSHILDMLKTDFPIAKLEIPYTRAFLLEMKIRR